MFGRCALRLRQCVHLARKRGFLPRCSTAGSGALVARYRQVYAPCKAETKNGHKRYGAMQAHRCGVLGYKDARRKRLGQRNALGGRGGRDLPTSTEILGGVFGSERLPDFDRKFVPE